MFYQTTTPSVSNSVTVTPLLPERREWTIPATLTQQWQTALAVGAYSVILTVLMTAMIGCLVM